MVATRKISKNRVRPLAGASVIGREQSIRRIITKSCEYTGTSYGHSRWQSLRTCEYQHHLKYHEHIRPKQNSPALDVGSAVHIGLMAQELASMESIEEPIWQRAVEASPVDCEARLEAARLLSAYFAHYGIDNAGWGNYKILSVEQEMHAYKSLYWSTRVDAVVMAPAERKHSEREVFVVDHKTSRSAVSDVAEFVRDCKVNPQFLGHALTYQTVFGKRVSVLVNLVVKSRIPSFERVIVRFSDAELMNWHAEQKMYEIENRAKLENVVNRKRLPIKNYDACTNAVGMRCWAFDYCWGTDQDRENLFYKVDEGSEA